MLRTTQAFLPAVVHRDIDGPEVDASSTVPGKRFGNPLVLMPERLRIDAQKLSAAHSPHTGNHEIGYPRRAAQDERGERVAMPAEP